MSPALRTVFYATLFLGFLLGYVPWQVLRLDAAIGQSLQAFFLYLGLLLFLLGVGLLFSGAYYLVLRGEGTPLPFDPPKRMVVAGPYARLRHPMMLGLLLVAFAEAFWFYSASLCVYAVLLAFLANLYLTYIEEPWLERRFGDDYRAYRDAVPRWFPMKGSRQHSALSSQ
jgi:protein-S-isoprenylcysteine O-methyltransferase Ste14